MPHEDGIITPTSDRVLAPFYLMNVKVNLWHYADVSWTVHWSFSLGRHYDWTLMTSNQWRNHDTVREIINYIELETCKKEEKEKEKCIDLKGKLPAQWWCCDDCWIKKFTVSLYEI